MSGEAEWWYVQDGERCGPIAGFDLEAKLLAGEIDGDTQIWRKGMNSWAKVADLDQVRAIIGDGPPPITANRSIPELDTRKRSSPGFIHAVGTCFSKYFTFSGRAPRSEYWYFHLFGVVVIGGGAILDALGFKPISLIFELAILVPWLAVAVRRLHDTNRSGWWASSSLLLAVISGIGSAIPVQILSTLDDIVIGIIGLAAFFMNLVILVWFCIKGATGPNRFGPDPFGGVLHGSTPRRSLAPLFIALVAAPSVIAVVVIGGVSLLGSNVSAVFKTASNTAAPAVPAVSWVNPLTNSSATLGTTWHITPQQTNDQSDTYTFSDTNSVVIFGAQQYTDGNIGDYVSALLKNATYGVRDNEALEKDQYGSYHYIGQFHEILENIPVIVRVKVWQSPPGTFWRAVAIWPSGNVREKVETEAVTDTLEKTTGMSSTSP